MDEEKSKEAVLPLHHEHLTGLDPDADPVASLKQEHAALVVGVVEPGAAGDTGRAAHELALVHVREVTQQVSAAVVVVHLAVHVVVPSPADDQLAAVPVEAHRTTWCRV